MVDTMMNTARERLFQRFTELDIVAPIVPYPTHSTVEEGKMLRGNMAGIFTKNLLLKDKKGHLYLFTVDEDCVLDLKTVHTQIGAQTRLNFASGELMIERLGVPPGALTPLAIINDSEGAVTVVVDSSLLNAEQVNVHPLINTESTGLRPADLLTFIRSCGREPTLVAFPTPEV